MSDKHNIDEVATEKSAYEQIANILKVQHFSDEQIRQIQLECLSIEKENAKTSLRKAAEKWVKDNQCNEVSPVEIFNQGAFYVGNMWKNIYSTSESPNDAIEKFDNWISANCRKDSND